MFSSLGRVYSIASLVLVFMLGVSFASPAPSDIDFSVKRADTPNFYLVASSTNSAANLRAVRYVQGVPTFTSFVSSGDLVQFYFDAGQLRAVPSTQSSPGSPVPRGLISFSLTGSGCSQDGLLDLVQGSSSNKCANGNYFGLQSNPTNAQLGSRLTFNWAGGFWTCGANMRVYYSSHIGGPTSTGSACDPISLYTVPVA